MGKYRVYTLTCTGDIADGSDKIIAAGPWEKMDPLKPIQAIEVSALTDLQAELDRTKRALDVAREALKEHAEYGAPLYAEKALKQIDEILEPKND